MDKYILTGFGAYLIWGLFPAYFRPLDTVPALQILAHRIVWSFVFLAVIVLIRRRSQPLKTGITPRIFAIHTAAAILLAVNMLIYVWSVTSGRVLDASLGYFINPLVNVVLGVVFFREQLRPLQWLAVSLSAAGVLYITLQHGSPPWIALSLAFTFGMYGLMKKLTPLESVQGLTLENAILFLPALGLLLFAESQGNAAFGHTGVVIGLLLAFSGVVTVIPQLMFATGMRNVPLSLMGILQYSSPTGQFLLGLLAFGEPLSQARLIGFIVIWIALMLYTLEGFWFKRKTVHPPAPSPERKSSVSEIT